MSTDTLVPLLQVLRAAEGAAHCFRVLRMLRGAAHAAPAARSSGIFMSVLKRYSYFCSI
ncbi:hypothetical protein [Mucilaginibacter koreensis]